MRPVLAGVVAAVLGAVAVVAHQTTPTQEELTAPFVTAAEPGEWAEGRSFAVRVESVALAEVATDPDDPEWVGATDGVWVVATLTAESALDPGSVTGSLWLGPDRYDASTRPGLALNGATLDPGLPEVGDLLFEVPADALDAHGDDARLWLGRGIVPRLDSVVEVPVDLASLRPVPSYELTVVERTTR